MADISVNMNDDIFPRTIDIQEDQYGIAIEIDNIIESLQQVTLAAFMTLNSTPQLQGIGVDWAGWLSGNLAFAELDSQIKINISYIPNQTFYPDYNMINNQLQVMIKEG